MKKDKFFGPLPPKWTEVYPYGTKEGDEIAAVFKYLSRDKKSDWHSTTAIVSNTGLPMARVEEIVEHYATKFDPPLIVSHNTSLSTWAYWECVEDMVKIDRRTIVRKDQDERIRMQRILDKHK